MMVWQLSEFSFEVTIVQPLGPTELVRAGSQLLYWVELYGVGGNLIFFLIIEFKPYSKLTGLANSAII